MDKYDEHITELRALSGETLSRQIEDDWSNGKALFQFMSPSGFISGDGGYIYGSQHWCKAKGIKVKDERGCGCLTVVGEYKDAAAYGPDGVDEEFTARIKADESLPHGPDKIQIKDLETFAKYQREFDELYRNDYKPTYPKKEGKS